MGAATICHPLDVVRVQMQTEGAYKNAIDWISSDQTRRYQERVVCWYQRCVLASMVVRELSHWNLRIFAGKSPAKKYFFRSAQEPNRVRSKTVDGYDQRRYRELYRNTLRISVSPYVK